MIEQVHGWPRQSWAGRSPPQYGRSDQRSASTQSAMPCPPPMHMVTTPAEQPDPGCLPVPQPPPAGYAGPTAHLLRQHLPRDARPVGRARSGRCGAALAAPPGPGTSRRRDSARRFTNWTILSPSGPKRACRRPWRLSHGKVAGYVVEGHVPVAAVQRMLTERPDIIGLAVPGMPMNSPGWNQGRKGEAVRRDRLRGRRQPPRVHGGAPIASGLLTRAYGVTVSGTTIPDA